MKKQLLLLALSLGLSLGMPAQGQVKYCASAAVGYGKNATGGGDSTPTLVGSSSELQNALKSSGKEVIIITQDITVSSCIKVKAVNFLKSCLFQIMPPALYRLTLAFTLRWLSLS